MNDLANTARSQWVSASINSSVVTSLIIAGVEPLNFTETNDISLDVVALRNNITAQQLRDNFEADIVLLFTDGNYNGFLGVVSQIGPDEDDAYGIVQVANATSTITWAHEAGHLFGARHDIGADPTPGDAHGHHWQTGFWPFLSKYRSIMGTDETTNGSRERVLHFSNPSVNHEGKATGVTGTSFNTRVINTNGHIVEDFRFTQPNLSVGIYGPGSANDGDLLSFTSSVSNGQSPFSYQWRVNTGTGYYTVGNSSSLNFMMPTDKDLEVILNVTDVNGQFASDYHFVRNLFLDGGPCTVCPDESLFDKTIDTKLEQHEKHLLIYPNPVESLINIKLPAINGPINLTLIDSNGKQIRKIYNNIVTKDLRFDFSELNTGIYYIKVDSKDGFNEIIRFIKN